MNLYQFQLSRGSHIDNSEFPIWFITDSRNTINSRAGGKKFATIIINKMEPPGLLDIISSTWIIDLYQHAAALDMKIITSPFSLYNYTLNRFKRVIIFLGYSMIEIWSRNCVWNVINRKNYNRMYKISDKTDIDIYFFLIIKSLISFIPWTNCQKLKIERFNKICISQLEYKKDKSLLAH